MIAEGGHQFAGLAEGGLPPGERVRLRRAGQGGHQFGAAELLGEHFGDRDHAVDVPLDGGGVGPHRVRHLLPRAEVFEDGGPVGAGQPFEPAGVAGAGGGEQLVPQAVGVGDGRLGLAEEGVEQSHGPPRSVVRRSGGSEVLRRHLSPEERVEKPVPVRSEGPPPGRGRGQASGSRRPR